VSTTQQFRHRFAARSAAAILTSASSAPAGRVNVISRSPVPQPAEFDEVMTLTRAPHLILAIVSSS
jgi:hypothetical protein